MTRVTVSQAVGAIRNETTFEGITTVLMDCTKAVMAEAYAELTVGKYCGSLNSRKKAVLALEIAYKVMNARENEAFKAQTVQEKLEHLIDCPYSSQLSLCTQEELKEMAMKLGVYDSDNEGEDEEYWIILTSVRNELIVRSLVKDCREIVADGKAEYGTQKERILVRLMFERHAVMRRMKEITGVESESSQEGQEQIAEYFLNEGVAKDKEESTKTETCESASVSESAPEGEEGEISARQDAPEAICRDASLKEEVATPVSKLVDVCAGVENYECGKLTEEELSEVLQTATAETLREYIMEVILPEKRRKDAA